MWKIKCYRSKYENFLCSFQKIQNNVSRIHLQCSGFSEILGMIITGPTELKVKPSIKCEHLAISFLSAAKSISYTLFSV